MSTEIGYDFWYVPVPQLLDSLRTRLEARGREKITIERYDLVFRQYLGMVTRNRLFSVERLDEFLATKRNQGVSSNSLRWFHNVFRTIYRVFNMPFPYTKDDVPPSEERYKPKFSETQALLLTKAAYRSAPSHVLGTRNRALVRLGAAIGLRRVELRQMDIQDIHFSSPENPIAYVEVQTQKHGRKVRREIDSVTEQNLREWVSLRTKKRRALGSKPYWGGTNDDPYPLFTSGLRGSRLGIDSISRILGQARQKAGIVLPRAGFHALRRMRVTGYHDGGASEAQITQEMGWRNPNTVKGYIMPEEETTKRTIREASPYFKDQTPLIPEQKEQTKVGNHLRIPQRNPTQTRNQKPGKPTPEPPAVPLKRLPTVAELRALQAKKAQTASSATQSKRNLESQDKPAPAESELSGNPNTSQPTQQRTSLSDKSKSSSQPQQNLDSRRNLPSMNSSSTPHLLRLPRVRPPAIREPWMEPPISTNLDSIKLVNKALNSDQSTRSRETRRIPEHLHTHREVSHPPQVSQPPSPPPKRLLTVAELRRRAIEAEQAAQRQTQPSENPEKRTDSDQGNTGGITDKEVQPVPTVETASTPVTLQESPQNRIERNPDKDDPFTRLMKALEKTK